MIKTANIVGLVAAAGVAFIAGRASLFTESTALAQQPPAKDSSRSQDKPKDTAKPKAPPTNPQDMSADPRIQAMMKAGMPGEHHKILEPAIGEFEAVVRFAMTPGGDMVESKGTVKREWVLDNHFIRETVEASSPFGGPAFQGIGYLGYNNVDGQYEFVWFDNESTGAMFETGTYNPEKKVMTMRSSHRDPATGHLMNGSGTWDLSNPNRQTVVAYTIDENGKESKNFEGVFERKK